MHVIAQGSEPQPDHCAAFGGVPGPHLASNAVSSCGWIIPLNLHAHVCTYQIPISHLGSYTRVFVRDFMHMLEIKHTHIHMYLHIYAYTIYVTKQCTQYVYDVKLHREYT